MAIGAREVLTTGHQVKAVDKVYDGMIPGRSGIEDRDERGIITQEQYLEPMPTVTQHGGVSSG